jgi:hypothetical protein
MEPETIAIAISIFFSVGKHSAQRELILATLCLLSTPEPVIPNFTPSKSALWFHDAWEPYPMSVGNELSAF